MQEMGNSASHAPQSPQESTMDQDASAEAASSMLNDLALKKASHPASRTTGPFKRKRVESVVEVHIPKIVRAARNPLLGSGTPRTTMEASRHTSGKLGRPGGKALQQVRDTTQPAAKKNRSDVYDFVDNSPVKPVPELTAVRRVRSMGTANVNSTRASTRKATVTNGTDDQPKEPSKSQRRTRPGADNPSASPSNARGRMRKQIARGNNHNAKATIDKRAKRRTEMSARIQEEESGDDDPSSSGDGSDFGEDNDEALEPTPRRSPGTDRGASAKIDTQDPKLLGQDLAWMQILKGARMNCLDPEIPLRGKQSRRRRSESEEEDIEATIEPDHLTKGIKELTQTVQEASDLYGNLAHESQIEIDDNATKGLHDILNDLEAQIRAIKEPQAEIDDSFSQQKRTRLAARARKEASEMIQDIYLRAVPGLVYLLRSAMTCRASDHPTIYDSAGLGEIVKIQDLILLLCVKTKAGVWDAKPVTDDPISAPVRSRIVPGLRDCLKKAFARELGRVKVQEKRKQNFLETQSFQEMRVRDSHEIRSNIEKRTMRISSEFRIESENFRSLRKRGQDASTGESTSLQGRRLHGLTDHRAQWTKEEEMELIAQLMNQDSRNLPGM